MTSAVGTTSSTSASSASSTTGNSTAITSTGIGSGLDITAIVTSLTSAFGAGQQNQITSQQTSVDSEVSAFGTLTSSLDTLQGTLSALETPSTLGGYDASVADTTIASATATSDAVSGSYTLEVQNLATAASLTSSAPVANASTDVGTGTLNISVGTSSAAITIDSTDDTLTGIAAAINGASNNPGVTASIITASDGQRLVLTGTATGADNSITITQSGGNGGLSALVYDPSDTSVTSGMTQTTAAADANFKVNGYAATSASNTVSGAISGVTLNLLGASATGVTTTVSVSPDTTAANTAITAFVTALNSTLTTLQSLTSYDASTETAGALQGNATVQSLQNQLANILDTITSTNSGVNSLADLGVTADANTGIYDTSASTLSSVLTSSLSAVGNLLGGTNGIATKIDNLVTSYTEAGGILATINDGLETNLSNLANQQTQLNAELATYSATLTTQYNAMDTAVASLKETQTYLTAEFNASATSSSSTSSLSSGTTST
jgi:flagellar hook-associated protein 2